MATSRTGALLRSLREAETSAHPAGEPDGELLERFVRHRDEAAVEALVRRHAPMVWGVCRRILRNHHDAEDALQATFIVLVRRAASVVPRETVANWLYGVARQTALKARQLLAKRRERTVAEVPEPETPGDLWRELEPSLDRELASLPEKYRVLVVLCHLEGRTRREAAEQLGLPEGTVAGRLARARAMLATRLTRRGVPVSAVLLPGVLAARAAPAEVVAAAVHTTIHSARGVATGSAALLAEGVMNAMFLSRLKVMAVVLLALVAVGAAIWIPTPRSGAVEEPQKNRATGDRPFGDPTSPPDLTGQWEGEDWGHVELKLLKPGTYEGTYTDTFGAGPGTIALSWSAEDRRFNGTWAQGKDRFGTLSVRPEGREVRGAFTTDPDCKIRPGKPALADLRWVRREGPPVGDPLGGGSLAWGKAVSGLRMGITVTGPKRVAVVIENTGRADTVLNLGILLANGKTQLPTAVRLLLTDPAGKTLTCEWLLPGVAGRVDPFVVPLPAGSRYTLSLPLDAYTAQFQPLAEGRYRLAAEFVGKNVAQTNRDMAGLALMPYWTGTIHSQDVRIDIPVKVAKSGPSELDGRWDSVSLESGGRSSGLQARWEVAGGEITESGREWMVGESRIEEWTFRVDPTKSPKEIDLIPSHGPHEGKTLKGIYKIERGTLTICQISPAAEDPEKQPRPTGFDTRRKPDVVVRTFEREKP